MHTEQFVMAYGVEQDRLRAILPDGFVSLPAVPTGVVNVYPKESFTAENAARISCEQVLGAYLVAFER